MPGSTTTSAAAAAATTTSASSAVTSGWSSHVETQAKKNMALCQDILACTTQLQYYKTRLTKLKQQHKKQVQFQALRTQAALAWPALTKKEKWKKAYLEAALASPELPPALQEEHWLSRVPQHVRNDQDLFLLRLTRPEFCHYYRCAGRFFTIPPSLRSIKEVVVQTVQHYPDILEQDGVIEAEFLDDIDVFRALLQSNGGVYSQTVQQFSARLRGNPELMLQVLTRNCYCLDVLAPSLRNDKEFALNFARNKTNTSAVAGFDCGSSSSSDDGDDENGEDDDNGGDTAAADNAEVPTAAAASSATPVTTQGLFPSHAIKSFSKRLRADKTVATAFLARNGGNLAFLSYPLRRDFEIVQAAISQDPLATVYCIKSRTQRELSTNKEFMVNVFTRVAAQQKNDAASVRSPRSNGNNKADTNTSMRQRLWRFCAPSLKNQREVVVAALAADCARLQDVPDSLKANRAFWVDVIGRDPLKWLFLPDNFKYDRKLASLAVKNITSPELKNLVDAVAERFRGDPPLDRQALSTLARVFPYDHMVAFWPWSNQMWHDKDILLQACRVDGDVLELVHMSLLSDRDVIRTALKTTPDALCFVPAFAQHMFPDLVARAIRDTPQVELWDIYESVDEDLWGNREVALAWAANGGDYLHDDFPPEMELDEELFLLIAQHNPEDFWCASDDDLLNKKEFMLKVVEKDGSLLRDASEDLVHDFDLALVAFAGTSTLVGLYLTGRGRDFQFLVEFATKVRARLEVHEGFVKGVLCGTTKGALPLSILNQGRETTFAYTKLIADFLGIPKNEELRLLRQASSHLVAWGF
jgi:hypothetical protein